MKEILKREIDREILGDGFCLFVPSAHLKGVSAGHPFFYGKANKKNQTRKSEKEKIKKN